MGPESENQFATRILEHFSLRGRQRAASFVTNSGRVDLTFKDVEQDCRRYAAAYRSAGLEPGGTVLIFFATRP